MSAGAWVGTGLVLVLYVALNFFAGWALTRVVRCWGGPEGEGQVSAPDDPTAHLREATGLGGNFVGGVSRAKGSRVIVTSGPEIPTIDCGALSHVVAVRLEEDPRRVITSLGFPEHHPDPAAELARLVSAVLIAAGPRAIAIARELLGTKPPNNGGTP